MPRQFDDTPSFSGSTRSATEARKRMFLQSTSNCSTNPSRCTLTTTSVPSFSVARWTWARDAAARGVASKDAKTSSSLLMPSSSLTIATARAVEKQGTSFWSVASSAMTSGGSTSTRVDRSWPNLMNVGPRSSKASRNSAASAPRAATASALCLSANLRRWRATRHPKDTAVRQMDAVRPAAQSRRLRNAFRGFTSTAASASADRIAA
mmetsp:Transcript_7342/g.24090  ORF Transcript_7342/g.24090 Transcript_7342/m.24090 type:complete len:208 (-) Transcript_7342:454-1077(-)